jgi:hypothetical protein
MEMIYLAITPQGLEKALHTAAKMGAAVWCGSNAMREEEFDTSVGQTSHDSITR